MEDKLYKDEENATLNYRGKYCLIYQSLILEFLKLTAKLYINIDKLTQTSKEDEFDLDKDYYSQCFEKSEILRYENISLRKNLLQKDIEEIIEDIKHVFKIKAYYIADIYRALTKNIGVILYTKPKMMETIKSNLLNL